METRVVVVCAGLGWVMRVLKKRQTSLTATFETKLHAGAVPSRDVMRRDARCNVSRPSSTALLRVLHVLHSGEHCAVAVVVPVSGLRRPQPPLDHARRRRRQCCAPRFVLRIPASFAENVPVYSPRAAYFRTTQIISIAYEMSVLMQPLSLSRWNLAFDPSLSWLDPTRPSNMLSACMHCRIQQTCPPRPQPTFLVPARPSCLMVECVRSPAVLTLQPSQRRPAIHFHILFPNLQCIPYRPALQCAFLTPVQPVLLEPQASPLSYKPLSSWTFNHTSLYKPV